MFRCNADSKVARILEPDPSRFIRSQPLITDQSQKNIATCHCGIQMISEVHARRDVVNIEEH
jgi:hypothetical protein